MKRALSMLTLMLSLGLFAQVLSSNPAGLVADFSSQDSFTAYALLSETQDRSALNIPSELDESRIFNLDVQATQAFRSQAPAAFALDLGTADDPMILDLVQVDIFKAGFQILEGSTGLPLAVNESELAIHYRGVIEGTDGSVAAISIVGDEVSGIISYPGMRGNMVLGKLENDSRHILYRDDNIKDEFDFVCQTTDEVSDDAPKFTTQHRSTVNCAGIHIDAGNDIYQDKGSSTATANYMTGLFNQVATLYANDNIDIALSGITVWTSQEPFNDLNSYGNYRGSNPVYGDLNAYVNYFFGGGVAWLNALCSSPYSVSGVNASYANVPTYSWSVNVLAHELGHNLGSQHTHACAWNGNNTAIDGCGPNAGYSEGCTGSNPAGGGTIMSYCHLTSVGVNFSLGFGPQPAARIANYLDGSSCANSCVLPTCDDGVQNGQETGIDCGGPDCVECPPCPLNEVTVTIVFDEYASETTYEIIDGTGSVVASGGPFNGQAEGSSLSFDYCIEDGCYDFVIYDSFGDGICCDFGTGSYAVTDSEGGVLASGGAFASSETTNFCVSGPAPVTCSSDFDTAPVDLTKSYDPVGGVQDRLQVKFYKASPQIKYSSADSAACDIKFWQKRFLDPETGNVYGDPIQNPDTTTLVQVQKNNNNPLFKWPIKYRADGANNANRVEPNFRYEWQVRCACRKGDGPYSPWSDVKIFNTPDFDPSTGIYNGSASVSGGTTAKAIDAMEMEVYPNPSAGILNVRFISEKGETTDIKLFDMLGNLVMADQVSGLGGDNNITLDIASLDQGNYVLWLSNTSQVSNTRITLSK